MKTNKLLKNKKAQSVLLVLGALVVIAILTMTYKNNAALINKEETISALKSENNALSTELGDYEERWGSEEVDNALALLADKEEVETELKRKSYEAEKLEKEIDALNSTLELKKEEPIRVSAGQYFFGHDIPEGRYTAKPVGRGTNFVVYTASGGLHVNTILSEGDYTFFAQEGYYMETKGAIELIPVE